MGFIKPAEPVRLFAGILSRDEGLFDILRGRLSSLYGPVDMTSPIYPWTHSRYYEREMGADLKRIFLFFEKPIQPDTLSDIKNMTNEVERYFMENAADSGPSRPVNIDPGYLNLSKVVLASTKDYSHRLYIGKGIYAEVALHYRDKTFQPLSYTYPDYRSKESIELFNRVREKIGGRQGEK